HIGTLGIIRPRLVELWRQSRRMTALDRFKTVAFSLLTVGFLLMIYGFSYSVLKKMASEPVFGEILTYRLLSFLFTLLFAVLAFSNVIGALSNLFLAEDNEFLASMPVPLERFYVARFVETMIQTSWMLLVFALPVLVAAGQIWKAPVSYYIWLVPTLGFFLILPTAIGMFLTLLLVHSFPARKMRDVLVVMAALFLIAMFVILRFLRPERLFNPDILLGVAEYLAALKTPDRLIAPAQWATQTTTAALEGDFRGALLPLMLLLSNGLFFALLVDWATVRMYPTAFSKALEGKRAGLSRAVWKVERKGRLGITRVLFRKEILGFVREASQWTQLLLLIGLVVIYLYNFKAINLERITGLSYYLINLISYVNIVLASMVVTAVAARFVLPAISLEGEAFWVLKSAPITTNRLLWEKFKFYWPPLFLLGEILVVATNKLMHADPLVGYLGATTMVFLTAGITGMAVGIGAVYPDFKEHNPARISTSSTSVLFMILAAGFSIIVVVIEYFPARSVLLAQLSGAGLGPKRIALFVAAAFAIALITYGAIVLPLRMGEKQLENLEDI
ncbi:MAG TPA: hypothetical protein ENF73_00455, partial [Proteobacteria bacterium]|nr:hypothetical protein [Pseudomonadota bacterium]